MQLMAKTVRLEEPVIFEDLRVDKELLRSMKLCEPEDFVREVHAMRDITSGLFKPGSAELRSISSTDKNFSLWEYELKSAFVEFYFPPLTAHHIFLHRSSGGIVRKFLHDKEEVHVAQADEISLIPANTPAYLSGCGSFDTLHITISPEFIQRTLRDIDLVIDPRMQLGSCVGKKDLIAANLVVAMAEYARTSRWQALNRLGSALGIHLLEHYGVIQDQKPTCVLSKHQLGIAREFMISCLGEIPDIEEIARQLRISTVAFCRQFKAATGVTPLAFYRDLRMQRARELVETSQKSLTEIAMDLGFTDAAHFSKAFHKHWGLPPSAFRA